MPGPQTEGRNPAAPAGLFGKTVIVGGVVVLALLLWQLSNVLLLGFAAALVAIILLSIAEQIERIAGIRQSWALASSVFLVSLFVALFLLLLGTQIYAEGERLIQRLPQMVATLGQQLGIDNLPERLKEQVQRMPGKNDIVGAALGYTSGAVSVLANFVLVVVAGIYLAAQPERHRRGLLLLVPRRDRSEAARTFDTMADALRLWLLGQLVSMTIVGMLTSLGLYVIGVPSALALGFLAGVAEFVPLVGPLLGAVPAVLLALSEGGSMIYWVIGLYVAVQQIEGNIIMPLVQRRAVKLPPVLTLFGILAMGVLFGPLGVLLGTPLTVIAYVAAKQLYVRDTLGEDVNIPGKS